MRRRARQRGGEGRDKENIFIGKSSRCVLGPRVQQSRRRVRLWDRLTSQVRRVRYKSTETHKQSPITSRPAAFLHLLAYAKYANKRRRD